MELRQLRNFVVVARTGSVSRAAEEVLLTQPALSRQMQALERELKLPIFERSHGRLALNAAGRELLSHAVEVIAASERMERAARSLVAGALDRITISAPATTEADVIAPFVATFGPVDPVPSIVDLGGRSDRAALEAGADIVVGGDLSGQGLATLVLCELPVWAYVPPQHEWASRDSVSLDELCDTTVLALDSSFRARRILDDAVRGDGVVMTEVIECTSPQVTQALAAAGRGVAVLTDDSRFGLHPLTIVSGRGLLTIVLTAVWSPDHHAAGPLAEVAERLKSFCALRYG